MQNAEVRMQNACKKEGAGGAAPMGSLWEWLQIRAPKESRLLFGVAPSDHEWCFVIMEHLYESTYCVSIEIFKNLTVEL